MRVLDTLDLTAPGVEVGQHGIWLPAQQIKLPFQWAGRIQKYRKLREASYSLESLAEEVALLRYLAQSRMAPPIGDWVYVKTLISEHPGAWWADPVGAYGYEMADAHRLPPGALRADLPVDRQIRLAVGDRVTASPGAWNDLNKPGNVINGYLVDARRSGWDRLCWQGPLGTLPHWEESRDRLLRDLGRDGQFPFRERELPYQEFVLDGEWIPGERDVRARAKLLGFQPEPGETVLDCGTQLGGFLHAAVLAQGWPLALAPRGPRYVGVDSQSEYIDLARRLARANGWNLCFRPMDLGADLHRLATWLATLWGRPPDHCLLLSMTKHLPGGEAGIWALHDLIRPQMLYLETNAVKPDTYPLRAAVEARGGHYLGDSVDRNLRRLYRVPAPPAVTTPGDGGHGTAAFGA